MDRLEAELREDITSGAVALSHLPERIHSPWRRWHPDETLRRNDGALEKPAGVRARFPLVTLIERESLQEILGETLGGAAGAESSRHIENTRGRAR